MSSPCISKCFKAKNQFRRESADGRTDRRYQAHHLPASLSYAVDNENNPELKESFCVTQSKCNQNMHTYHNSKK